MTVMPSRTPLSTAPMATRPGPWCTATKRRQDFTAAAFQGASYSSPSWALRGRHSPPGRASRGGSPPSRARASHITFWARTAAASQSYLGSLRIAVPNGYLAPFMGFGFRVSRFGRGGFQLGFGFQVSESVGYKLGFGFRIVRVTSRVGFRVSG